MLIYETIYIDKNNFDYFQRLSVNEQLKYLFDLFLEIEHDIDVSDNEFYDDDDLLLEPDVSKKNNVLSKKILDEIDKQIINPEYLYLIFSDDLFIISANDKKNLDRVKLQYCLDGMIYLSSDFNIDDFPEYLELKSRFKFIEILQYKNSYISLSLN